MEDKILTKYKIIGLILLITTVAAAVIVWLPGTTADINIYEDNESVKIEVYNVRFHPLHIQTLNEGFGGNIHAEVIGTTTLIQINKEFYYASGGEEVGNYIRGVAEEYNRLQRKALPPLNPSLPLPDDCSYDLATQTVKAYYRLNNAQVHVEAMDHFCTGNY